ncbi:PadR family transcriptional regulator [Actinoplanes sp. CA-030573]|uniref:PadR family transcriptional regulator n=1 Tax=Actinoplanes sp. CA-030573 TaxID=3239898 RepID=UPI003D8B5996
MDPGFLILTSLAEGAKHGYAITADVAEQAGVTLGPGTLYAALQRLEEQGLIEGLPAEGRRRPYRLTPAGAAELSAQATRMHRLAALSLRRLNPEPA